MTSPINLPNLRRVNSGDPITAIEWNAMVDQVEMLSRQLLATTQIRDATKPHFLLADLAEDVESRDAGKTADEIYYDGSVLPGSDPWTDSTITRDRVVDIQDGLWLQDERHLLYFNKPTNQLCPIPGLQMHIAKLDGDLSAGGSATASIWEWDGVSAEVDSTRNITVNDFAQNELSTGDEVFVFQHRQSKRWYVLSSTSMGFKKLVRFVLEDNLLTTDATATGTIEVQYGSGTDNTTAASGITLTNTLTHTAGVYIFEGDIGDRGLAYHDTGTTYVILMLECI